VFFVPAINDAILSLILIMVNVEKQFLPQRRKGTTKAAKFWILRCAFAPLRE